MQQNTATDTVTSVPLENLGQGTYSITIEVPYIYIGPHKRGEDCSLLLRVVQIVYISCICEVIDNVLSSNNFPQDSKVLLCGDFNDLHKFRDKIIQQTGLKAHVNVPTRLDKCLDLIFSSYDTCAEAKILPPLGRSDHSVLFWKPPESCTPVYKKVKVRNYSKANIARFRDILISTDWLAMVMSESNLDVSSSIFLQTLKYLFDLCFPEKSIRIRSTDPVWMSFSLRKLINDRDTAWHRKDIP